MGRYEQIVAAINAKPWRSSKEIAADVGISPNSVSVILCKAGENFTTLKRAIVKRLATNAQRIAREERE